MEGVVGYFDHTTVPGRNDLGPVVHDEEIFASDKVTCIGPSHPLYPLRLLRACMSLQELSQVSTAHSVSPCIMQACWRQALHSCRIGSCSVKTLGVDREIACWEDL